MFRRFRLEVVSPEQEVFSGYARRLFVTGTLGELEILHGHAPLLTSLNPGKMWIVKADNSEEGLIINGGFLEVQPEITIVLANMVIKPTSFQDAKNAALNIADHGTNNEDPIDYNKALSGLNLAMAELSILRKLNK